MTITKRRRIVGLMLVSLTAGAGALIVPRVFSLKHIHSDIEERTSRVKHILSDIEERTSRVKHILSDIEEVR